MDLEEAGIGKHHLKVGEENEDLEDEMMMARMKRR